MIRISQSDARILRDDHRAITRGESGRGSLHRPEGGGETAFVTAIPAKITAGDALTGYTVQIFANGINEGYTGTMNNVFALDMAIADSACVGEYVYIYPSTIAVTGGI